MALGKEVKASSYTGLKTNILLLGDNPSGHAPGFARGDGFPDLNPDRYLVNAITEQLAAYREAADYLERGMELAQHHASLLVSVTRKLGYAYALSGRAEDGLPLLHRAVDQLTVTGHRAHQA